MALWVSGVFRFLSHIPAAFYGIMAAIHAVRVSKFPVLLQAPYHQILVPGQRLAAAAGIITFSWNLLIWLPALIATEGLDATCFKVGDYIVTILLGVAITVQALYLPPNYSYCRGARHFGVPDDAPSMFLVVANGTATSYGLRRQCEDWVLEWVSGVVVFCFFFVIVLCNCFRDRRDFQDTYSRYKVTLLIMTLPALMSCFMLVLIWICIFGEGNTTIIPYYLKRIRDKWRARNAPRAVILQGGKAEVDFIVVDEDNKKTSSTRHHHEKIQEYEPWLPFDIIVLISQHLHGVDLVNLSMTSKRVRAALGGIGESNVRLTARFSNFTCVGPNRRLCWGCGVQTCGECHFWHTGLLTILSSHADRCRPSCHRCMIKKFVKLQKADRNVRMCSCRSTGDGNRNRWATETPAAEILQEPDTHVVCGACYLLPMSRLKAKRMIRDGHAREQLCRQPTNCHFCEKKLAHGGARFWACNTCEHECESNLHLPWSNTTGTTENRMLEIRSQTTLSVV